MKQVNEKVKECLNDDYVEGVFKANSKLDRVSWIGKQVDDYVNKFMRISRLVGFLGRVMEWIVKLAFVTGFPDYI